MNLKSFKGELWSSAAMASLETGDAWPSVECPNCQTSLTSTGDAWPMWLSAAVASLGTGDAWPTVECPSCETLPMSTGAAWQF
eukprot:4627004-Karenia_brevis.AAC.1